MGDFAQNFVNAFSQGQQSRRAQMQEEFEAEDRKLEKDLHQLRLRELKITEQLRARDASIQNLGLASGRSRDSMPSSAFEQASPEAHPVPGARMQGVEGQDRLAPMQIPGVEELGVPGMEMRPESMEDILTKNIHKMRTEAMWTPQRAPRGGRTILPATQEVLAEGDPFPEPQVWTSERDASGVETRRRVPESEAAGRDFIRHPTPGQGSTVDPARRVDQGDIDNVITGIMRGDDIPELPSTEVGLKIRAGLSDAGFNRSRALSDMTAVRAHYRALNAAGINELRISANSTLEALEALETAAEAWGGGGFGPLNSAQIALAKRGSLGQEAQDNAIALEGAVGAVRDGLSQIASGGAVPTNRALEDAVKLLSADMSESRIKQVIASLEKNIGYRIRAINSLEPITPDSKIEGGGGGDDRVMMIHPETGQPGMVPASQVEAAIAQGYKRAPTGGR